MDKNILKLTVIDQYNLFKNHIGFINRNIPKEIISTKKIAAISGVRRSGKSTLLCQISKNVKGFYYLNFEDERLLDFSANNFNNLLEIFYELFGEQKIFFFDEIQNVYGWEKFVRRLFNEGFKIYITGSNSKLLSSELATSLTGRHIKFELFPFSFVEFLTFLKFNFKENYNTRENAQLKKLFNRYVEFGGFPEIITSKSKNELSQIYQDVLIKDLIVRFKIKEVKAFRELGLYLLSNITSPVSFNNLQKILSIKSVTSIKNYMDFMEESYLLFSLPKYDYSLKKQIVNDRKIYTIDTGMYNAVSFNFSANRGVLLENIVFLELKRRGCEIFYHKNKYESDFVVRKGYSISESIQVTESVKNIVTREREIRGITESLQLYNLKRGIIITYDDEENIKQNGFEINVIPIWKWLLN